MKTVMTLRISLAVLVLAATCAVCNGMAPRGFGLVFEMYRASCCLLAFVMGAAATSLCWRPK